MHVSSLLGLKRNDYLSVFNVSAKMFQDKLFDRVMDARVHPVLFIKTLNVDRTIDIDNYIKTFLSGENARSIPGFSSIIVPPPIDHSGDKRKASDAFSELELDFDAPAAKRQNCPSAADLNPSNSPPDRHLSPLPEDTSQELSTISTPITMSPSSSIASSSQLPTRWPIGLLTCQVAKGLARMSETASQHLNNRFLVVFTGYAYKKSTFARHKKFWTQSTQQERDNALTSTITWHEWTKTCSGNRNQK